MHAILLFFAFENKPNATGSILMRFNGPTLPAVLPGKEKGRASSTREQRPRLRRGEVVFRLGTVKSSSSVYAASLRILPKWLIICLS